MSNDNQKTRWQTPPELFDPLDAEFFFDTDAAADAKTTRLKVWLEDALNGDEWPGDTIWLNPPYGRMLDPFVREAFRQAVTYGKTIVACIPFRCRAAWWHECIIGQAIEVRCIRKRVNFVKLDGNRGAFTGSCDSCIVVWNGKGNRNTILTSMLQ